MRKLLLISILFLFGLTAQAQDNMLAKIREANASVKTIEAPLKNTTEKSGKTTVQEGMLYFVSPNKFASDFSSGEYMIVNEKRLKIDKGVFHGKFKLREGGMMESLTNIFLYGFQGRCEEVAEQNNFSVAVSEKGPYQQVCCTNKKRSIFGLGYKTVIYNYDKETLLLKEIILIDNKGITDTYTTNEPKYNGKVDDKHFDF
ncbi:MAG: hypothetical protein K6A28_00340 [Bacteroidales bacterium]|nr:hypothetical protein [Bacteroidales bacterium]